MNPLRQSLLLAPLAFFASAASAVTLTLNPSADTYVRSDNAATTSGAAATEVLVGQINSINGAMPMHALFTFDLSTVPVDASINSVSFVLRQSSEDGSSNNTTITLSLHLLTQTFVENQASWNNRVTGTAWTTAGGTYDSTVLSTVSIRTRPSQTPVIALPVDHTWASTSSFVSAVQAATDASNSIGFLLKDTVETNNVRELIKFSSKEGSFAPQLIIDYTVAAIPEPSSAAVLTGLVALAGVASRRRRAS